MMIPIPRHIPALQQMPQEMLGWHYEFECGFGIPVLKKPLAQSPQTPETPKTRRRGINAIGIMISNFLFDSRNEGLEP
jgi:hypothetical protein